MAAGGQPYVRVRRDCQMERDDDGDATAASRDKELKRWRNEGRIIRKGNGPFELNEREMAVGN